MSKNNTYKGFTLKPYMYTTKDGEILNYNTINQSIKQDIINAQALMQWEIDNHGQEILDKIHNNNALLNGQPNTIITQLGLKHSSLIEPSDLSQGRAGRSRYAQIIYSEVIASARSWYTRLQASKGTSKAYVSQGFKRTARPTKPTMPYRLNLGYSTGGQYAKWSKESYGSLLLVVNGQWIVCHFRIPERYQEGELGLPIIRLNSDSILFDMNVKTSYQQGLISTRFVVGIDVGKVNYVTVSVWDEELERVVMSTTLSQRVHSLWNSIQASEEQKKRLRELGRLEEAKRHREAASRKKEELACLVGLEVARLAYSYGNAVVVVEDLSWVRNTMLNGRWNRGRVVSWVRHYVEMNGSRVLRVGASGTSQDCSRCGSQVVHYGRVVFLWYGVGS